MRVGGLVELLGRGLEQLADLICPHGLKVSLLSIDIMLIHQLFDIDKVSCCTEILCRLIGHTDITILPLLQIVNIFLSVPTVYQATHFPRIYHVVTEVGSRGDITGTLNRRRFLYFLAVN